MENLEMGNLHNEGEWESLSKLLTFDEPDLAAIENSSITNTFLSQQSINSSYNNSEHFSDHFDPEFNRLTWQVNDGTMDHGANEAFLASIFAHDVNNDTTIARNEDGSSCSQTDNSDDNNHNHNQNIMHLELLADNESDHQRKRKCSMTKVESKKKVRASNHKGKKNNVVEEEMESAINNGNEEENNGNNQELNEQNNMNGEVSEDNGTIGSLENGEGENSTTSKGKKRANRGAATDPQSLYARKRRQRINERLRILQSLVPNGTKVDISTMLEEAVHYVKFLQLQIRLLSSDELWMYAPIAYSGFDISHFRHYSPFQQP